MVLGDWSKTSHQNRKGLNFLGRYRLHVQTTMSILGFVFNLRTPVYESVFPVHAHGFKVGNISSMAGFINTFL